MADTIANPFNPVTPIGKSLAGLARVMFTGPSEAERISEAEKALKLKTTREGTTALSDVFRQFGQPGFDRNAGMAAAIQAGYDPKNLAEMERYGAFNTYGVEDPRSTNAFMSAGGAYGSTVAGTREAERAAMSRKNAEIAAENQRFYDTPLAVAGPQGPVYDTRRGAIGKPAVESLTNVQGNIARNAYNDPKGIASRPVEEQRMIGAESKTNPTPHNVRLPTGENDIAYAGPGGLYIPRTNEPAPRGTTMFGVQGNPEQVGLTGNATVDKQMLESRIASQTAAAAVDRLTGMLSQPNAAQSTGYLGTLARGFNDLRSQVEATASLFGGERSDQAFASPEAQSVLDGAVKSVFSNPGVNQKAQQLGINASVLRSQIQDLAYMIAKTQDPNGKVSIDDIRRAAETVGASIMDPTAAIAVLGSVKQRIMESQAIRERVTKEMFPNLGRAAAPQPAPAPAAPAAATPAPQAAGAQPVRRRWNPATGALE